MKVFISAGEASGDALGAALLEALARRGVDVEAFGMGGPRMQALGFRVVRDASELNVVGLVEVLRHLPRLFALRDDLARRAIDARPDLAILIDVPDFNLRVAKALKRAGIPVIFYVGPSVWAWRPWRARTFARHIDRLLVLFPFELPVWQRAGVDVVCVGHPLVDELPAATNPRALVPADPAARTVALLPGSRWSELDRHLGVMLDAATQLRDRRVATRFVLPVAPTLALDAVDARIRALAPGLTVELVPAPAGDPRPRREA
ncbi:lipid-A-disaccharide synthase, partial [Myxococcota bacterium]|nr:lipid-A-disaccharide synthase [Myxococcota bacterium]